MDFDLLIIFGFVLLAGTLVFNFATAAHRRSNEHEERKLELEARAAEARNGSGSAEFRKLEERVRVLERIATDSNHALASQIESLRDLQELDAIEEKRERAQ